MSSHRFCFTTQLGAKEPKQWFSGKEEQEAAKIWKEVNRAGVKYLYFQIEQGEKSKLYHIQGYLEIECKKKTTFRKMASNLSETSLKNSHIEICGGSLEQNKWYCSKNETALVGPFEFGIPGAKTKGKRTDLEPIVNMAREGHSPNEIARAQPELYIRYNRGIERLADAYNEEHANEWTINDRKEQLEVHVLWGAAGSGKTRQVYEKHKSKDIYSLRRSNNGNIWFDGYHRQEVLLIDEFNGWIPLGMLLKMLDVYPMQVDKKGGYCYNNWKTVYIISNRDPNEWYPNIKPKEKKALFRRIHTITRFYGDESDDETSGNEESSSESE